MSDTSTHFIKHDEHRGGPTSSSGVVDFDALVAALDNLEGIDNLSRGVILDAARQFVDAARRLVDGATHNVDPIYDAARRLVDEATQRDDTRPDNDDDPGDDAWS